MVEEPVHPVNIPRREKDFQGMLEYKKEDELKLIKNLILGKEQEDLPLLVPPLTFSWCPSRVEASRCSRQSDPRSASLHPLHVSETRRLRQRRPEGPHPAHLHHQQHQEDPEGWCEAGVGR